MRTQTKRGTSLAKFGVRFSSPYLENLMSLWLRFAYKSAVVFCFSHHPYIFLCFALSPTLTPTTARTLTPTLSLIFIFTPHRIRSLTFTLMLTFTLTRTPDHIRAHFSLAGLTLGH